MCSLAPLPLRTWEAWLVRHFPCFEFDFFTYIYTFPFLLHVIFDDGGHGAACEQMFTRQTIPPTRPETCKTLKLWKRHITHTRTHTHTHRTPLDKFPPNSNDGVSHTNAALVFTMLSAYVCLLTFTDNIIHLPHDIVHDLLQNHLPNTHRHHATKRYARPIF